MDWSAIFAGIAALTSIAGLVYSVEQHRDNIRKEFILWALEQMQSPTQRDARRFLYNLNLEENSKKRQKIINGIKSGDPKILDSEDYGKIRAAFALFGQIGYFLLKSNYGNIKDVKALFPHLIRIWDIGAPYITAMRGRPNQERSFLYFEKLVAKLKKVK
jgi:hypothetical protein